MKHTFAFRGRWRRIITVMFHIDRQRLPHLTIQRKTSESFHSQIITLAVNTDRVRK